MKAYIVKKKGEVAKAFVEDFYIGLVADPTEHIRSLAMEHLLEGLPKGEKFKVNTKELKNVVVLELEE